MDSDIQAVIARVKARCKAEKVKPSTFGQKYFKNTRFFKSLTEGSLSIESYAKLIRILDEPIPETNGKAA